MKNFVVVLAFSITLVYGQFEPPGHTPDYDNPKFILDIRNEVIAIVTKTGCYLYHMTDTETISAGDPGGLNSMEDTLVKELKATKSFPAVASHEFHHLDNDIRHKCTNDRTFDIHDVRN